VPRQATGNVEDDAYFELSFIDTDELRSEASYAPAGLSVRLVGSAESTAVSSLGRLLGELHGEAMRLAVREVTVDVRELEFINSCCFKAFVAWLSALKDIDPTRQYRIRFLSDARKHWQRPSLGALSSFAIDLVQVDTRA
jgi:hypothetical protein